jgi:hypothetical protein
VAILFLAVRLYARFRGPRRLYWDDAFVIVATVPSLATAILWQWAAPAMYYTLNVTAGLALPTANFPSEMERWLRVSYAVQIFFYVSLTTVKLSLLFFFRRLGYHMDRLKYVWWPVVAFTVAVCGASIGNSQWRCLIGSAEYIIATCDQPSAIEFTTVTLKVNCALDVFSDFLSESFASNTSYSESGISVCHHDK